MLIEITTKKDSRSCSISAGTGKTEAIPELRFRTAHCYPVSLKSSNKEISARYLSSTRPFLW